MTHDRRLLADIGATYARFCVEDQPGRFEQVAVLRCADHAGFIEVVQAYLDTLDGPKPRHGAVALANPVEGDSVRMTNREWAFSIQHAQRTLGLATLLVVNNFTALAMALPNLDPARRRQVGSGDAQANGVIALLGPGTGLGVSGLVPTGDRWVTLATEGGHTSFAPADARELQVLQFAWQNYPHVSTERLVSGPGIELIHRALYGDEPALDTAEIVRRALAGGSDACTGTLDVFCAMLGTVASNLALTLGASGGVYIGGGIVPRLGDFFDRSRFRERFEAKGRFSDWVARVPTYVVTAENLVFDGVSSLLAEHVPAADGANPLLERVRGARTTLSPAERRVADYVLDHPRAVLNDPIALIAQLAEVSQPTVIRFCRTLGFQGLADFKLKLGSGLTGTLPMQRTQVRRQDGTADLTAKVLDNTVSAIVEFRETINVGAVDQAIGLLRDARRVEWFAMGHSALVALDAQNKLLQLRVPSVAHTEPSMLPVAAELLSAGDVAVFVSSSGRSAELLRAAQLAQERGATVLAITAGQSPLAKRAQVCIAVEHGEDSSSFVAMVSRILHLLVVDLMATGVAVRRNAAAVAPASKVAASDGQELPAPGVLISHAV